MAVAGEQILTRLGFEVDGISLKSSLEKAAAFGSALRRAFADASAAFVGVAKGEAEVAAQADALGVSVERFAEWRFIAEQTGASSDALGASLKAMLANNPGLSDAASELERAGGAMREMGDAQREAYARGLGIDPSLIPMLTRDVSGLRDMFRSLYATAGTDAAQAAEDGKGFLDGMARLAGLCDLLAKTVALSLVGTARSGIEALGDAFVAHFDDIRRVLELVVALASAAAPAIGAALGLLVSWGGQLAGLLGTLDADLVAGIGKGIAAFMALRGAVGAAIIGFANLKEAWALLTAAFSANPYLLAIGAAVTLAVVVMDNWGAVKAFLLGVWDAVASGARAAVDAVASAFDNAVNFVTGAGSAIAGAVGPAVSSAMGFAGAAVSGAADLLASAFGGAADVVSGLFSGMGAAIGIALQGIMDGFRLLGGLAAAIFSGDLSGALDAGIGLFRNFGETALGVFPALGEGILGGLSSLWGRVTEAFPDFGAWASGVAESVGSAFSGALDVVGPAASEAADRLSSALSGAVAFVSDRFPSLGAAAEAVGQGLVSEFQSIRDLVASVFSGDLSSALDAALGLFSGFRETAFAIFAALGEAVLGVFAFVWGQVTASFPDFGAWAASSASAVAGAFGKALGWVREKLYGLVDMLPDWALEKLGWKRLPDAGAEDGMPGFRAPYAHGGQGAPAGNGGSGYGGLSSGNAWGAGSAAGVSSGGAWGAGSVGGTPSDGAFAGAPAGGLGTGGSGAGSFGADGPGGPFFPGASGGSFGGAPGSSGQGRAPGGGSSRAGLFGPGFGTQPFFSPSTEAYLMAAPWQSAAMASAGGAVSLESRTEINVSGASSPDEVARRVAVEQDNINADLIRYAQGAAR
ncbi:hypothetical protein AB4095_17665 [Bilophila wadsworthia]|uniref:hypothetical protein n=1 Tax=Bilophila wadsworthia TaxID=35833 RepID=UPI0034CDC574